MNGTARPTDLSAPIEIDVAVVGSGAAGLAAALTAAANGLKVAVFEKHVRLGGTSAWSSGWMWVPGSGARPAESGASCYGARMNNASDPGDALEYLQAELGPEVFAIQRAKIEAFLHSGPEMLQFFRTRFPDTMDFEKDLDTPDFHASPGQHLGGRMVRVPAFDGRSLGANIDRLRPPLLEFTFLGMAVEAGADLAAFLVSSRALWSLQGLRGLARVIRRLSCHVYDLVTCGRAMRLVNGNALVARMVACAAHPGRDNLHLYTHHAVVGLHRVESGVNGIIVRTPAGLREVRAQRGVVLACGGFPHDMQRIHQLFPPDLSYSGHCSAAPPENSGDGLRLGEEVGGQIDSTSGAAAALVPVSLRRRRDGSLAVYPHFVERSRPGVIAVQQDGRRFSSEAIGYHAFVQNWCASTAAGESPQAWLVCGWWSLVRFGLGMVKPGSLLPLYSLYRGYLKAGWTVQGLARRCGIDAAALSEQVRLCNEQSPADAQFDRGGSAYEQSQGDPLTRPNPCVGKIGWPYFAVRLQVGSLGTLAGLRTDEHARVLDIRNEPIPGLYACGNDMSAVMGGLYPTNGVTLASAMTFGHRAGCHIVSAATSSPASQEM